MKKTIKVKTFLVLILSLIFCSYISPGLAAFDNASIQSLENYGDYTTDYAIGDTISIYKYNGTATTVNIPSTINGKKVTRIGSNAFYWNTTVKNVTIPNTVTDIDAFAFSGCKSVETISLPSSVTSIGMLAFSGCSNLKNISLPSQLKDIGIAAFSGCTSLTSIRIPDSIKDISTDLFQNCSSLSNVVLGKNVKYIYSHAFYNCSSLKTINLNNVEEIYQWAFSGTTSLATITFPSTLKSIGSYAFTDSGLKNIVIPGNVRSIGIAAFMDCNLLETVKIENGLKEIYSFAFKHCPNLYKAEVPVSVTQLSSNCFMKSDKLVMYGIDNSDAHEYAKRNEIPWNGKIGNTKTNLSNATVTLDKTVWTETGGQIKPTVTVKLNGKTLSSVFDYTVSYSDNIKPSTSAKVTITGKGNYTGTKTVNFTINAKTTTKQSLSSATVSLNKTVWTETGYEIKPTVTVKLNGKTLSSFSDYTISYSNNIKPSTSAKVTITGKGNYTGTKTVYFTINAKTPTKQSLSSAVVTLNKTVWTETGSQIKPTVTVKLNGKTLSSVSDYTVSYSNNIKPSTNAKVTVTGKGNYTGTKTVYFTINAKTPTKQSLSSAVVTLNKTVWTETGSQIKPTVTVKLNGKTLSSVSDYTISYSNNIKPSTNAKVTVTGKGNYTGSKTVSFTINAKTTPKQSLSSATVTLNKTAWTETGSEIKPTVTVKLNGKTLSSSTDYTVSYSNNIKPSTNAKVTVTGKGNYSGSKSVSFTINAKTTTKQSLSSAIVTLNKTVWDETGYQIQPTVTVKLGTNILRANTDYTVKYSNNISPTSSAKVTVEGIGNYTGSKTVYFTINKKVETIYLSSCEISLSGYSFQYTGSEIKPSVTVRYNSKILSQNTDYSVSYGNNLNPGTGTVTVTGKNNVYGTKTLTFTIVGKQSINNALVVLNKTVFDYTGSEIKPIETVTINGNTLRKGIDYSVRYVNNVNPTSTAQVIIEGIGSYTGSRTLYFTIMGNSNSNNNGNGNYGSPSYTTTASAIYSNTSGNPYVNLNTYNYSLYPGNNLNIKAKVTMPQGYQAGSHRYTVYLAYLSGGRWQEVKSFYLDGGTADIDINMLINSWPKGKYTFTLSLFDSSKFTSGNALYDQTFFLTIK